MSNDDSQNGKRQTADAARRQEAFKIYCQIGNLAEVGRRQGISQGVVYNWASKYNWKEKRHEVLNRLKHFLDLAQLSKTNEAARMFQGELNALDHINSIIANAFLADDLKPKTFTEAIRGLDFVTKRKHEILQSIQEAEKAKGNSTPPSTEEERALEQIREQRQVEVERLALENAIDSKSRVPEES